MKAALKTDDSRFTIEDIAEPVLPAADWVKARVLSIYQMSLFGGLALGSWGWGHAAEAIGTGQALAIAGAGLLVSLVLGFRFRLPANIAPDLSPITALPRPAAEPAGNAAAGFQPRNRRADLRRSLGEAGSSPGPDGRQVALPAASAVSERQPPDRRDRDGADHAGRLQQPVRGMDRTRQPGRGLDPGSARPHIRSSQNLR